MFVVHSADGSWAPGCVLSLNKLSPNVQRAVSIGVSLYSLPLGTKQQEIVVSRGKILELLRPDANTGKVHTLLTMEVFGIIRSLMAFRLTGGTKGEFYLLV